MITDRYSNIKQSGNFWMIDVYGEFYARNFGDF